MTTSLDECRKMAPGYGMVPVVKRVPAGGHTVEDLAEMARSLSKQVYVMDHTVDTGKEIRWERYAVIGFAPALEFSCTDGVMTVAQGETRISYPCKDPSRVLAGVLAAHKAPYAAGMPPFTGGLAGYFAYEYIKYAEPEIQWEEANPEQFKDMDLFFFDRLFVLDRQQQEILLHNADNQRQRDRLTEITHAKHRAMDELTRLEEQLKNLQEHRGQLVEEYNAACVQEKTATKTVAQLQDESTAELEQSIRNVEEINRQVSANLAKSKAQDEAERYAQEYTALTEQIKAKRTARMDLLNGADLPLTGLGVEDGSLTYNGKHWQDMSGSDQLRVATAIVRRLNPDCGFVLLDKLEQMDLATLAEFGSWLQAEGLQAIATRVSTGGECQIIIEDGRVKDAEEPPAPKAWTKGAF